jgi:hypothetical protein
MRKPAVAAAALLALPLLAADGGAATRGCGSFNAQAAAQGYFLKTASGRGGRLDRDRDGVACEHLPGPYKGFATLGFNRRGSFLYGYAWMPATPGAAEPYACTLGNRSYPEGPRRLNVYRIARGGPRPLFARQGEGAAADMRSGRLAWKAPVRRLRPGRYFVEFEERQRLGPYEANQCPRFRSRAVRLP